MTTNRSEFGTLSDGTPTDTRREIAAEADRVLAEHFTSTLAETAESPECQALFDKLSPKAQRVARDLVAHLDQLPSLDAVEETLDLVLGGTAAPPAFVDDDPIRTPIDDGRRSGIRLERYQWPDNHSAWLDFNVGDNIPGYTSGRVMASVDLYGGKLGIGLVIHGESINDRLDDIWTLADLRRLRDDLDRLLRDARLVGALAEQR